MIRLKDISDKVRSYHPEPRIDLIEKAYVFSAQVHKGQLRLSGEPYLTHPMEVAALLALVGLQASPGHPSELADVVAWANHAGLRHPRMEDRDAYAYLVGKALSRLRRR